MQNVKILRGTVKLNGERREVSGLSFPLVEDYQVGREGGYVTVDGRAQPDYPNRNIRVFLRGPEDVTTGGASIEARTETDEEIIDRLRDRFQMLEDMTKATKKGDVRAMIVSGPPGVGKSHGVEKVLGKHELLADIAGNSKLKKYEVVKGAMSPIGLYCKLYQYADKDNVIVFDDCDSVFDEPLALNILKAALDSKKTRTINWNTDSFKLRNEGVPDSFKFEGSCIFITNINFEDVKSKKIRSHLEALESRCHYIDLTIDTEREKMLRIKQIVKDGMLTEYRFEPELESAIVDFVDINKKRLRELSLRTVLKVADLAKAFPDRWEAIAENTVMKR
jgi:hypothetical protein